MIYLDSADPEDVAAVAELGFVSGITTNPSLIAKHGRPPLEQLGELLRLFPAGPIFYQPSSSRRHVAETEAREAHQLDPARVVIKLPATWDLYELAFRLVGEGAQCAMTAVYSPGQAVMARQVGCGWIIPYVDRARRLMEGGEDLVGSLAEVLGPSGGPMRILAASLKGPEQVSRAVAAGAHAVTLPMSVLVQLSEHPLTTSAISEFERAVAEVSGRWEIGNKL